MIAGRLESSDIAEITRVRQGLSGEVTLDLGGVSACAEEGIRVLRTWLDDGARLDHAAPFVRMRLETAS
jgi:hypothetical protein